MLKPPPCLCALNLASICILCWHSVYQMLAEAPRRWQIPQLPAAGAALGSSCDGRHHAGGHAVHGVSCIACMEMQRPMHAS
jgi:hypothetical protein